MALVDFLAGGKFTAEGRAGLGPSPRSLPIAPQRAHAQPRPRGSALKALEGDTGEYGVPAIKALVEAPCYIILYIDIILLYGILYHIISY